MASYFPYPSIRVQPLLTSATWCLLIHPCLHSHLLTRSPCHHPPRPLPCVTIALSCYGKLRASSHSEITPTGHLSRSGVISLPHGTHDHLHRIFIIFRRGAISLSEECTFFRWRHSALPYFSLSGNSSMLTSPDFACVPVQN